jgi:hypothetical protein
LIYTDTPCKGGERPNLKLGVADPAAMLRLERAQGVLDELAATRRADESPEESEKEEERVLREHAASLLTPQPHICTSKSQGCGLHSHFLHPRPLLHRLASRKPVADD